MYTRTVEVNLKHDMKPAFFKKFKAEVLPILKRTPGFFDEIVLENENEPTKIFTISFWETQEACQVLRERVVPEGEGDDRNVLCRSAGGEVLRHAPGDLLREAVYRDGLDRYF